MNEGRLQFIVQSFFFVPFVVNAFFGVAAGGK
jgi:hypothetical protein